MNVGGENKAGENSCVRFSIYGKLDPIWNTFLALAPNNFYIVQSNSYGGVSPQISAKSDD